MLDLNFSLDTISMLLLHGTHFALMHLKRIQGLYLRTYQKISYPPIFWSPLLYQKNEKKEKASPGGPCSVRAWAAASGENPLQLWNSFPFYE